MFEQVLSSLSSPPSSLVYHFLVLFSVEAALAMAFGQWLRERDSGTGRLTLSLFIVGLARALVVIVALLAWQGTVARHTLLPPIERTADALTALALMWAFVTMDAPPMPRRRNTVPDVLAVIGLLSILGGGIYSTYQWANAANPDLTYNILFQDLVWGVVQISLLALGLLWMLFRIRHVFDAFLKAILLILLGAAIALHLSQPPSGDIASATRLGLVITMPMLAAVTYRHIVDRLLTYDAFHATADQPLVMPEAVAEAIRALPPTPDVEEIPPAPAPEAEVEPPEPGEEEALEAIEAAESPEMPPDTAPSPFIETDLEPASDISESALVRPPELPAELMREYPNAVHVVEALSGLIESLDVDKAANYAARSVATALRADVAAIISMDEERHIGEVVAAYDNISQVFLEGGILSLDEQPTIVNALGRLRQMRLTPQRNMSELRNLYKVLQIMHSGPAYVQPLHSEEHRLGVLIVGSPYAKVMLSNAERTLLDRFGGLITTALLNATTHYELVRSRDTAISEAKNEAETAKANAEQWRRQLEETNQLTGEMEAHIEDLERQVEVAKQTPPPPAQTTHEDSARVAQLESELEATRNASQVELAALRARLTTSTISQQEVIILQEQLMAKAREVINLQTRAAEAQMTVESLRTQLQTQMSTVSDQQVVDQLQAQVTQQKLEIAALQKSLAEAQASSGLEFSAIQQQAQLEAADREAITDFQARLTERNTLVEALQAQLSEKSQTLTALQSNVSGLHETLGGLEDQLHSRNEEIAALQASLDETRAQARQHIQNLQSQLESQTGGDQSGVQEAVVEQLEAELAQKSAYVDRLETQLASANDSLTALEAQLAATNAAVESAITEARQVDAHDEVIASIAQELRTPMTSIMGYTDLLLGESVGIIGALQRKFLQRVKANTELMSTLLDNLISITALDSGQFQLEPQKVDVTTALEEAITGTVAQFQEKSITLRLALDDPLPTITADRDALHQTITHLLTNASLASPIDGEVMLTASQVEGTVPGPDGSDHETTCVHISVTDSGPGIKTEDQERVFLRKYRADNPLIEGLGDTGVALSIARTLVEAHGGRIWLESEQNIGSTFNILLPVERLRVETALDADGE